MIDQSAVDKIRVFWDDAQKDSVWKQETGSRIERRKTVQREILQLLHHYVSGAITADEFKTTFHRKTSTDWDLFGLKGMSGAIVLNQIVKHIGDEKFIAFNLKPLLSAPPSEEEARLKINTFIEFVHTHGKGHIQEGHSPFFLSAWWHMQSPTEWPIFYISARTFLQDQDIYQPKGHLADDYLQFRSLFNELLTKLNLEPWWLELFLAKLYEDSEKVEIPPPKPEEIQQSIESTNTRKETSEHTQAQWLLASLGRKFGCNVWIARNDHSRTWNNQELGTLSITSLPSLGLGQSSERIIQLIDVVWLKGNQIQAAFEIECSTSIYSGLLRMSDLAVASPNLNFPLFIVAPKERGQKVKFELSRPTFQQLELHKRCGYIELEELVAQFSNIHKWAEHPSVIKKLATWVSDSSL